MADQELLPFGQAAKSMCSPDANFGHPPRQAFVIQLDEARKGWKRRNPELPLRDSIKSVTYVVLCMSLQQFLHRSSGWQLGLFS
jgi:hypothetical protein